MQMKNRKIKFAAALAAMTTAFGITAFAACSCPYGYYGDNGPNSYGACNCLEMQGPGGSGVCTCNTGQGQQNYNWNGQNYNNWNNPAYNTGWTGGGPGASGTNPGGSLGQREEDKNLSYGPGSEEAKKQLEENEKELYIFGDPCTAGTWEQQESGSWKFRKQNGQFASSEWVYLDGKTYLINYDGTMLTGFCKVNGKWYYFNSVGAMQKGWLLKNGKYYFLNADGSMAYGWVNTEGKWYYMDGSTGAMLTNSYTPDGRYVNAEGILV